ncbi:MAG: hypothetical protein ABGY09_04310 [Euryarchaeota archaeon]
MTLEFGCRYGVSLWIAQQYACMVVTLVLIILLIKHARTSLRVGDTDCFLVCTGTILLLTATGLLGPLNTLMHLYRILPTQRLGLLRWSFVGLLVAGFTMFALGLANILSRRPPRPFRGESG